MATPASPGSPWQGGDAYERFMGRWSRRLVPVFLDWIGVPAGRRWLDVGCGTGALAAAVLERCAPASLAGVDPSEGFLATARARLPATVVLHRAPWKNFVRRFARDLKERRKPPHVLWQRGRLLMAAEPGAIVSADAASLDTWLWRRDGGESITVTGRRDVFDRFQLAVSQPLD